jgi:tRNA A-37 threonylcarbamoyl transferase component Bud32
MKNKLKKMDYTFFEKQNYLHLKELSEDLKLKGNYKNKKELIIIIMSFFNDYEKIDSKYKTIKKNISSDDDFNIEKQQPQQKRNDNEFENYTVLNQIGNKGKEGVTYLVKRKKDGKEFAMKTFKKNKSKKNILHEANCQNIVSKIGICPKVIDVDLENNFIVMEKLECHLYEIMKKQKGNLTKNQQQQIFNIFKKLDEANVFHADSNILNYMMSGDKIFIIDFGMSKMIDDNLKKKLETDHPNKNLMTLGFILKLKELKCPESSYSYLISHISQEDKVKYNLI